GPLGWVGQDQLGAVGEEVLLSLAAGVARKGKFYAVAAFRADHRVGDAGVAAGGVDEDLVARQEPAALAVEHHVERRPVLHAAAGSSTLPRGLYPSALA